MRAHRADQLLAEPAALELLEHEHVATSGPTTLGVASLRARFARLHGAAAGGRGRRRSRELSLRGTCHRHASHSPRATGITRPPTSTPAWLARTRKSDGRAIEQNRDSSIGNWVRLLHAVLRRKARCEAALESAGLVTTDDVLSEVDRFKKATGRLPVASGRYL